MAFNTRSARPQTLSTELRDWCAVAAPEDCRTLVVRLLPHAEPEAVAVGLRALGAEIVSSGQGVLVATIAREAVLEASRLPGVVGIEAPSRLHPK